ncbi:MAG TPA: hypothetical protein VFU72_04490 [Nitrolancea sp.]|nr:hypothetical protein [Nitrolancea sp.]
MMDVADLRHDEIAANAGPFTILSAVAWPLAGLSLALIVGSLLLATRNQLNLTDMGHLPFVASAALVGGVLNRRRPANLVGWLFTGTGLSFALLEFTGQYASYGLITHPGALPFARALAWPQSWLWVPGGLLLFAFLPLLFPQGRLITPGWRWVLRANIAICLVLVVLSAVLPGGMGNGSVGGGRVQNPLGIAALSGMMGTLNLIGPLLVLVIVVTATASLVTRFRHSRGLERQQMKWLTFAVVLYPVAMAVNHWVAAVPLLVPLTLIAVPLAAGLAIFRYRLYDIDWLIDKTLVYIPLTAILAGLYSASTTLCQRVFVSATGETSGAAIVLTTLTLAAAFTPIKNSLQAVVDRRYKPARQPLVVAEGGVPVAQGAEERAVDDEGLRALLLAQQEVLTDLARRLDRLEGARAATSNGQASQAAASSSRQAP